MAGTDGSGGLTRGAGRHRAPAQRRVRPVPWGDVLLTAVAAVSWAYVAMGAVAALGLHLLEADAHGRLGPLTAAVVLLAVGGTVRPSGDVSAFGLDGGQARTAVDLAPLGVALAGALLLAYVFLRSLRRAGTAVGGSELAVRAGAVVLLFAGVTAGLAWAGRDAVTFDGRGIGNGGGGGGGTLVPGLGSVDLGDLIGGGGLRDGPADLVGARASVGFRVDTVPSVLGALLWAAGVLAIALLVGRCPLPGVLGRIHRQVRPAASALVSVALAAVAAGWAAAAYAAVGDEHPRLIAGSALLGAPNGVWTGVPLGLFVPFDGQAEGALAEAALPDPLGELLRLTADEPVTVDRLAGLDGRVWLLAVGAAVLMLHAGVLAAARTPIGAGGAAGFAVRCAVRLGALTALALPLLVWLTRVSVGASLSVLGFDAFGAGIELAGRTGRAAALGALWGAGAGCAGALLVYAAWYRGRGRLTGEPTAVPSGGGSGPKAPGGAPDAAGPGRYGRGGGPPGPYDPAPPYRPPDPGTNPYLRRPPDPR
ncbi:streptophobe family protein [Streptomyces sp. NPDC094448]|uniref:streptophobe family protein n=1 Tax=Streptomyces sp. NPDC094448 TaxID=3366063 RepID=UPI0037F150CF